MRKVKIDLEELMNILCYGEDFGSRAIIEDLGEIVSGIITAEDIRVFINSNLGDDKGYDEGDRESCQRTFDDIVK